MPRYQITKIFFVQADNMDHAKKLVDEVKDSSDELKEHDILEIDLIEEDDDKQIRDTN